MKKTHDGKATTLKEFRKLTRGLPDDTEIVYPGEWDRDGNHTFHFVNEVKITHGEEQGGNVGFTVELWGTHPDNF